MSQSCGFLYAYSTTLTAVSTWSFSCPQFIAPICISHILLQLDSFSCPQHIIEPPRINQPFQLSLRLLLYSALFATTYHSDVIPTSMDLVTAAQYCSNQDQLDSVPTSSTTRNFSCLQDSYAIRRVNQMLFQLGPSIITSRYSSSHHHSDPDSTSHNHRWVLLRQTSLSIKFQI